MKCLSIIFINIILLINLHAKTTKELISKIANTNPTMQYVFWVTKDESSNTIAYLSLKKEDDSFGVWCFTSEKKWQPIHNASEFDGFDKADNVFDNISLDKTKETITFTSITNEPMDDVLSKTKLLENNTFDIGWYFWVDNEDAFLFSKKKNNEFSIWHLTSSKKWQPIHNTSEFDGFNEANKTLKNISFEKSSGVFSVGSVLDDNNLSLNSDAFIMTINTDNKNIFQQNHKDSEYIISINPNNQYTYDYSVDCNSDGIKEAENVEDDYTCVYETKGIYNVSIEGLYPHKFSNMFTDNPKLLDIKQWGNIQWKDMNHSFYRATNMKMSAKDKPNLSKTTNMRSMFDKATSFNQNIGDWDVSRVTNMRDMLLYATSFNQDIGGWDVSRVENMRHMFNGAESFNQDIGDWDVSMVKDMVGMFGNAESFNQSIGDWNVSRVENMVSMFGSAKSFNQDIGSWDVSSVGDMFGMFDNAESFNQDIGNWDVSRVGDMDGMFFGAKSFNQDLTRWKINIQKININNMFGVDSVIEEKNKPKGI